MRLWVKEGKEFAPDPPTKTQVDNYGKVSEIDKMFYKSDYDN